MFKKILIAYDGSENSRRAAQLAGELARKQEDPSAEEGEEEISKEE